MQFTGQGALLQGDDSERRPHLPPLTGSFDSLRVRDLVPPPHFFVHFFHGDHGARTQSMGHGAVLQACCFVSSPQAAPSLVGLVRIILVAVMLPEPQGFVQLVHSPHGLVMQAPGHGAVPHLALSDRAGHLVPLSLGCSDTVRMRIVSPPPHSFEHLPNGAHGETLQLMGHGSAEHEAFSVRKPHSVPPDCGLAVIVRLRTFSPPPHVRVHLLYLDQALVLQFIPHGLVPHGRCSFRDPQSAPPLDGFMRTARFRSLAPPPHDFEHAVNSDHVDNLHCVAQGLVLHWRLREINPQPKPP